LSAKNFVKEGELMTRPYRLVLTRLARPRPMVSCGTSGKGGVSKSAMAPTKEATSAFAKATAACTRCSCVGCSSYRID
jgi:hypothetical protein